MGTQGDGGRGRLPGLHLGRPRRPAGLDLLRQGLCSTALRLASSRRLLVWNSTLRRQVTWSSPVLDKPFVVGKSGRALVFVTCDTRVEHGLDVFDVPCVVTTKIFFILPHAPTLPTISVGFGVWSNCRRAQSRHFCWRAQHEHTTVGETKAPMTGEIYPHLMASPKVHMKRSLTVRHVCVSCSFAENTPNLGFISGGIRRWTAPSSALPRRGMIRRCGALTMTATNDFCGIVRRRRATTRGSTVCLVTSLDKAVA